MVKTKISLDLDIARQNHFSKSKTVVNQIHDNFKPLHLALWFHGVGYRTFSNRSKLAHTLLSMYPFLCDAWHLYFWMCMVKAMFFTSISMFKIVSFIVAGVGAGELLRFLIFKNWMNYLSVIGKVIEAYHEVCPEKTLRFKWKVAIFVVVNATWIAAVGCVHSLSTLAKPDFRDCLVDNVLWGVESEWKDAGVVFMHLIFYWSLLSVPFLFFGYFYFVCYVISESLLEFDAKLKRAAWTDSKQLLLAHNRLTGVIFRVGKLIEAPIMLTITIVLFSAFFDFFSILFTPVTSAYDMPCWVLKLSYNVLVFSFICFGSSRISSGVRDIKESAYRYLVNPTLEDLALVVKVQDQSVGFWVYDTFNIDKGLLLTALGTLISYGIMIATWGESSRSVEG